MTKPNSVSLRSRNEVRKPVLVKSGLHRRLKRVSFSYEVKMHDLADAIVESVLNDEAKLEQIIQRIKKRNRGFFFLKRV